MSAWPSPFSRLNVKTSGNRPAGRKAPGLSNSRPAPGPQTNTPVKKFWTPGVRPRFAPIKGRQTSGQTGPLAQVKGINMVRNGPLPRVAIVRVTFRKRCACPCGPKKGPPFAGKGFPFAVVSLSLPPWELTRNYVPVPRPPDRGGPTNPKDFRPRKGPQSRKVRNLPRVSPGLFLPPGGYRGAPGNPTQGPFPPGFSAPKGLPPEKLKGEGKR